MAVSCAQGSLDVSLISSPLSSSLPPVKNYCVLVADSRPPQIRPPDVRADRTHRGTDREPIMEENAAGAAGGRGRGGRGGAPGPARRERPADLAATDGLRHHPARLAPLAAGLRARLVERFDRESKVRGEWMGRGEGEGREGD